jgi:hypothetical protein
VITLPINTTRDLTPAELAAAQSLLDATNPPPGSITVVNTTSFDGAFGGTVTLNTDGNLPQEQFWRALSLPAVPLCATGPNVTLDFSADLTVSGTVGSPQGFVAVLDATQVGVATVVAFDSITDGNGTWTLSFVGLALDLAKFQNGDYVAIFGSAETGNNGPADFAWANASASITYDDAACGPVLRLRNPCGTLLRCFSKSVQVKMFCSCNKPAIQRINSKPGFRPYSVFRVSTATLLFCTTFRRSLLRSPSIKS